jgi:hypothetical protein
MSTTLKILSLAAKGLALATALNWTGISPKFGILIFMVASAAKDVVNRVGDYLDDGQANNSFGATR